MLVYRTISLFLFRRKYFSHFELKAVKCATTARLSHLNVCRIAGSSKSALSVAWHAWGFGNNKFIYKVNYTAPQVVIEDLSNHQEKQLTLWYT